MKAAYGNWCRLAVAFACAVTALGVPAQSDANPGADPGTSASPGMEIHQGSAVCMVGLVEPELRVALTTGQCDGGESVVTDRDGNFIGSVVVARRQTTADTAADSAMQPVEYEVIALAPDVTATDLLPTGRHLRSAPGLRAEPGLAVCQLRSSTGQSCGPVGSVSNGRFAVPDVAADGRELGGPVYALGDGNDAVIVGLLEGTGGSAPQVESWQAVMRQLSIDTGSQGGQQAPPGVRLISRHLRGHAYERSRQGRDAD